MAEGDHVISMIDGKWKLCILSKLSSQGVKRFTEISDVMPAITKQMLTNQLRELELAGIIHREVYKVIPPKVEYSLTKLGESLIPVLKLLEEWAEHNPKEPPANSNVYCQKEASLQFIGGKWKLLILSYLGKAEAIRFMELKHRIPQITKKMLTTKLRELEEDGIIHREVYPVIPPKVEYSLNEKGKSLMPIIQSFEDWDMLHRG